MKNNAKDLITKLGLDKLDERYTIVEPIGDSFGGSSFVGHDSITSEKVFIKYLICYRGEHDISKFLMERDALDHFQKYPGMKVTPKLLYFKEFPDLLSAVIITEFINGQSLSNWLSGLDKVSIEERLQVFHRIVVAMSRATLSFKHRDIHPGNIILLPCSEVAMGPSVKEFEVNPAIRIIDWGESLPVIFGNYDDEPDHNFVLLQSAPRQIGGSITSLPPEVFSPWKKDGDFGGKYETWGLGLLLHRIILENPIPRAESLGHYAQSISDGSLENWVRQQVALLEGLDLPGGRIIPRLLHQMLQISPHSRFSLSDVGRILWDIRYEEFSIEDDQVLEKYFSNPREYEPTEGWRYSSFPDFD